jgi:hypothetical protein
VLDSLEGQPRLQVGPPAQWYRVHEAVYHPLSFNPSPLGNARFSPFRRADNSVVAALYAGDCIEAALMETVFHEVPVPSAKAQLSERSIMDRKWVVTQISNVAPLTLVDLSSIGLRRIGLSRQDLIDTNATGYPATQAFARELYLRYPKAQGIRWVSRLYDEGVCIVLYEDRITPGSLLQTAAPVSVLAHPVMSQILDLVDRLDMRYLSI